MSESLTIAPAPSLRSRLSLRQATSRPVISAAPQAKGVRPRLRRLLMGPAGQPRWARPLLIALLVGTAALYLVDLSSSGMANEFYAAAVKSGTQSLKAWLFGSLDAANAITVDKPPAALWIMVLSARIFGFSSFSMLLPQALMGVGTVALTCATVKRWAGAGAGLVAGALIALTPVAALMFRFNNPDALVVLLMTAAAYAVVRAIDAGHLSAVRSGALHWMVLAGSAFGFAFLTKMFQGLLVLPAFGLVYLIASPLRLRTRIGHLLAAAGSMIISAGWFVALVELWPAAARPYIGGSTGNSLWELALGYNGLSRIFGGAGNGGGTGGGNTGFGGATGITRMFGTAFGAQVSWFIPAALLALLAGLLITRRAPRTDTERAGLILWGGWLIVTMIVFSFMSGTVHPYYAVALAPAIGALVAIGGRQLWQCRQSHLARGALALMIAGTADWGWYLMTRDASGWQSWLAWAMLVGGVLGALVLAISAGRLKRFAVAAALVGSIAAVGGSAGFTAATAATAHSGSIPMAGPSILASTGMDRGGARVPGGQAPTGQAPSATTTRGGSSASGSSDAELVTLLNATTTRWSAAVVGDQAAADYILSTNTAVMAIGGWSGSDDAPTLAQFQQYVKDGKIGYFIASTGSSGGPGGGSDSSASQISAWVAANYTATTVGGTTVYDLTG
jgi:4-amino-4-deoxy-L-arabinose transferase-like glycosyltransferase